MLEFCVANPIPTQGYSEMENFTQRNCMVMYCFWLEAFRDKMTGDDVACVKNEIIKLHAAMQPVDIRRTEKRLGYAVLDVLADRIGKEAEEGV